MNYLEKQMGNNYTKKSKYMKYLYSLAVIALFAFGFSASDDDTVPPEFLGTYTGSDYHGTSWKFTFNEDKTMTAEGNGNIYYGEWYVVGDDKVAFSFSGEVKEHPKIYFKTEASSSWISNNFVITQDGFLYHDGVMKANSRDPEYRFKIRKIK